MFQEIVRKLYRAEHSIKYMGNVSVA